MGGPGVKPYVSLFFTFAKIGVCTFGGGYAMLPILQRELVDNKGWATEEELADYYAVGQCTPGVIAVNTATFVGYNRMGWLGGVVATLGVVFPCLVIIMAIAAFLSNFMHLDVVVHAFNGVRAGVVALILSSVLKLLNTSLVDWKTRLIYVVVLLAGAVGVWAPMPGGALGQVLGALCSPVFLVVVSGLVGLAIYGKKGGEKA
ncbi:chromate transporter [Pseudoflavonifractor sp. An187]|uniref:chromate transporter n=1 Tax=Pseudoflavonifractor sp. An187 TaxID=1965578 RepID=UPI000B39703E|nr:chromate transporter [Pseudoflavonifractor sp. An187]OUP42364.1 chromate transporter [Pseudoflavonifractor sp. An187]